MFKCQICGKKFNELPSLYNHLESKHKEMIPKDMSVQQYYYFMKTGKRNGNCVMCKKPTTWNKNTNKYNRFCGDPKCKDEYVKIVKGRMVAKYGKVHLLNDPNKQREMLANRSISGKYTWSNSTVETTYTGSYELDFLKMLDLFFEWDPVDISMPSPHTYTYEYQGEQKFYIPDAFIHSLGLEIEIKDGGDNPNNHHKIQAVDKEKERLKDEVMTSQKMFHYVKITNKNYSNFFDFLKEIKEEYGKHDNEKDIKRIFKIEDIKTKSKPVNESYEIIEENYLFNEDDIYLNIDKFERGEKHILFITGHSGSGKSTLAKSLAKKYNAEYVELDRLTAIDDKDFIKNTVFEEYVKQKGLENFSPANLNDDEFAEFVSDFIDWLIHERTHQKLVVEGIQVFCVGNPHIIKDYPIIIKNVSVFNSIIRARKRDYNNWLSFIKGLPKEIYWRITDDKYFRKFKKEINESYEIIEEGNVFEDIILKLRRRSLEENRAFINMAYNVKKDNPEEMKKYIMKMGKEFNYKKDLLVIKDIVDTTEKYYKQKAKENPEFKKEYFDFVKWYDKKLRWEIEYRLKHIKESTEHVEIINNESEDIIEEKFEPDKFLVWFDKPLKKALGGKIRIYHGSSILIEKEYIDPISFNVGATKFSEPRWSTYFWDNREDAMCWASAWEVSEHHKYTMYIGHNGKTLLGKPDGVDDKTFVKDLIEKMSNSKFYIYECEIDIRDLEIGSVPSIKEYTVSKPVKILKRFEYKLNKEIVRRCFEILPIDEVIKFKEENKGVKHLNLHRNFILNNILDNTRDSYRAIMRTDLQQGNINIGDDLSDYKYSINRHVKSDTYNLREEYIHESSISISYINKCLQQDTDRLLKQYLQDYTDFYHRMMKEQPASIPHINEDIKKAILAIDDLSKKENVNNDLLKSAKWCLGDLVNLNKNSSPIKQSKHTQSLVEGYHKIITPGSTIWVGADWHFYTGYNDQLKENPNIDRLVNNFNAKVKDTDVLIFIGDLYDARRLFDLNRLPKLDRIKKLKGYKIIVKGNHDVADDDIYYKMGFDEVCERYEVGNVVFTHEPCEVKANQVNVHGHLHYSKSYWYIKPTSHIDAYTARFDYQPMLVEDVVLNYNDGFLKPQAMDKFIKTFHVNKSSVKECYEPEYNELINGIRIKLVTENLNKRSFGIMDKNTRIIINDKYTIQRDNGLKCSVRHVVEGYENKEVMEFEIKYNSNIDIEQLINETLDIGLTIGGLYIPTDKENKLIQEVCLKLFGSYPDKCNFYK